MADKVPDQLLGRLGGLGVDRGSRVCPCARGSRGERGSRVSPWTDCVSKPSYRRDPRDVCLGVWVCVRGAVPAAGAGLQPLRLLCSVPATGETKDPQDSCWISV